MGTALALTIGRHVVHQRRCKMKKVLSLLGIALLLTGCSTIHEASVTDQYQKIVEIPKGKGPLYDASMLWITGSFASAKTEIQYSDKESGIISCLSTVENNFGGLGDNIVSFKLLVEIKDNRVRLTFSDVRNIYNDSDSSHISIALDPKLSGNSWNNFMIWADKTISDYQQFVSKNDPDW
jgi:hypothetical protein